VSAKLSERGSRQPGAGGGEASATKAPDTVPILKEDPYSCIEHLGDGAYRTVDEVECAGRVYTGKRIRSTGRNRENAQQAAQREFAILKRLKHQHVIQFVEIITAKFDSTSLWTRLLRQT